MSFLMNTVCYPLIAGETSVSPALHSQDSTESKDRFDGHCNTIRLTIPVLFPPMPFFCLPFPLSFSPALGQIMLYVDGMNGLISHNETIQWLYTLVGSKVKKKSKNDSTL